MKGYGKIKSGGRNHLAHRVSWMLHHGEFPGALHVLHHCDNPACVRPDHLFIGTNRDNVIDRVRKGRRQRWSSPPAEGNCRGISWESRSEWKKALDAHLVAMKDHARRKYCDFDAEQARRDFARLFPVPPVSAKDDVEVLATLTT